MANINSVILEGNLVKAAELSFWSDGTPYCKFTIANNEYYKEKDGNYTGIPSYIDCLVKGNFARVMSEHLHKGRRIIVSGRLKQQTWQSEDGQKHSKIVIKVAEISLSIQSSGQVQQQKENFPASSQNQNSGFSDSQDMFDNTESFEDIPF